MENIAIADPLFKQAVEAIDSGDITGLQQLIGAHPHLVRMRLNVPTEGYFQHPYLLWFIADNPIRHEQLPANIVAITRLIMEKIQQEAPETFEEQIGYALGLVATGRIPRECGVQVELIDLFIDAGAKPNGDLGPIAHGNIDAAKRLIQRGGELTLAAAVGLGWENEFARLAQTASPSEMQLALLVAAFFGKAHTISFLIENGVDVNGRPDNYYGFHSHASALHQAVYSGSLQSVQLLVEAGARLNATDRIYGGTPLGWAQHMQTEDGYDDEGKRKFAAIEAYLTAKGNS